MQDKIRRDPLAHLQSLRMDSDRKMLIVEGREDRFFIEYLSNNHLDDNLVILEVDSIDISENVEGGNRGRLLYFASLTSIENDRIRFFIDKDYSHFIGAKLPPTVTETDFKDIESYLINKDCFSKFLKIGIKSEKISANEFLNEIAKAKYFGFIRIASLKNNLNLSVNKTNEKLSKYLKIDANYKIKINTEKYLYSLIQNSIQKITMNNIQSAIDKVIKEYGDEDCRFIIHGKDLLSLVTEISKKLGNKKDNIENIFWMSIDKSQVNKYENLNEIIDFCKKTCYDKNLNAM